MVEGFDAFLKAVNTVIWQYVLTYVLIGAGLWFTLATRLVQFRRFGHLWTVMLASGAKARGGITSFQAFAIGVASRVGTGNIAGVAIALTLGGPGAIFWMWCVALLGMATAFVEATLAQLFKTPQPDGTFRGGPAFYIERGLGSRRWGMIFAVLLLLTFGLAFNAVQANTIADSLRESHAVPAWLTALGLVLLAGPAVFGGIRVIGRAAGILLPVMAVLYLGLAAIILVLHADRIPDMFVLIVRSAFGLDQAVAGATGGLAAAMLNGVRRGLFSNEAGMGSAPNAAATATTPHPASQGFVQALGVFIDTLVVCSATAFIILLSDQYDPTAAGGAEGAALTQRVVVAEFGEVGAALMTATIFLFAFSSIIGNYAYADGNLTFLGAGQWAIQGFRMLVLAAVALGAVAALPTVWALADIAMGLMALVNLVAIMLLSRWALGALADYDRQHRAGATPRFAARDNPDLPGKLPTEVW